MYDNPALQEATPLERIAAARKILIGEDSVAEATKVAQNAFGICKPKPSYLQTPDVGGGQDEAETDEARKTAAILEILDTFDTERLHASAARKRLFEAKKGLEQAKHAVREIAGEVGGSLTGA